MLGRTYGRFDTRRASALSSHRFSESLLRFSPDVMGPPRCDADKIPQKPLNLDQLREETAPQQTGDEKLQRKDKLVTETGGDLFQAIWVLRAPSR